MIRRIHTASPLALFAALVLPLALPCGAVAQSSNERQIPACSHAALHAGSCVEPQAGRLARVNDAQDGPADRCGVSAGGGGMAVAFCRYDGSAWRELSPPTSRAASFVAAAATDRVLDILNPPPASGLVAPVGDGIDGEPLAPRTDDSAAINAAIQFACDNDYDIAYLGPGVYRIGAPSTGASFYSGIRIDAKLCPNGIRFYGAGVGRTILLANGEQGQYIIFTTDEWSDPTRIQRIGWSTFGGPGDGVVTSVTTGVTPPVVTGSDDPLLEDGDTVFIRNCSGTPQMNERIYRVDDCTDTAPFSCELQDTSGVDIDATNWATWNPSSQCVVTKLNTDFIVEIAYMTLRDDAPAEHTKEVCDPICSPPMEESHGIGILQGGGRVEVHHLMIDAVGDEAIDVSAPESPTYIHDVTILDPEVGGVSVYQGLGVRVEDVLVHKGTPSAQFLSFFSAGTGFSIDPGRKVWRVVDLHVNRMVATGRFRYGASIITNSTGSPGQFVSGVRIENSAFSLNPPPLLCAGNSRCGGIELKAGQNAFPMEDIAISGNVMTGSADLELQLGAGGLLFENNTLTPLPNVDPKWGIVASSIGTTIVENTISGFGRGCIRYESYPTLGGSNATITTTIARNQLACDSNSADQDDMVGSSNLLESMPAPEDDAYLRIVDNQITASATASIRHAVEVPKEVEGVEICRNTVTFDPAIDNPTAFGIFSKAAGTVVCDNDLSLRGGGVRVEGDGAQVVGNRILGGDATVGRGVLVRDASNVRVSKNELTGYDSPFAVGIRVEAGTKALSGIQVIGNRLGPSGTGVDFDGNGFGIDDVGIASNIVDLAGQAPANAILLHDATNVRVLMNDLLGLGGSNVNGLLTTGSTDFITVRRNLAEGGGTLKFGTTGGDASCDPAGGVGANSTCADNTLQ